MWTLQTAAVQWQRGLRADAIVWVRRAADTSVQTGQHERAEELRDQACRLAEFLWTEPQEEMAASGLSNPSMPQHPQTLQEIAALDELEDEAVILEGYELDVVSRRPVVKSVEDVTDLTLDDLDEEVLEDELLDDESGEELLVGDDLSDDDLEFLDDDHTPPDGVPHSVDVMLGESDPASRDSFLSISPEDEDSDSELDGGAGRDSFLSISPESESPDSEPSERPTLPHPIVAVDPLAETQPLSSAPPTLRKSASAQVAPPSVPIVQISEYPEESPELEISASDPAALRAEILSTPPDPSLDTALANALLEDLAQVELLDSGEPRATCDEQSESPEAQSVWSGSSLPAPLSAPLSEPLAPLAEALPLEPEGPAQINGLALEDAEVVADLPEEAQRLLVATAEMHTIDVNESLLLEEGIALVTEGSIHVMLDGSEVSAARLGLGAVVAIDGSLGRQPLELVADASMPRVAVWPQDTLDAAMSDCPWVVDDLRVLADRFQAQAGAGQGEMGGRLDDALRAAVYERLEVKVLQPGEVIATEGKPLSGLFIVAAGEVLVQSGDETESLPSGQFVFAGCVIGAEPAPANVVAGANGALALFASRPVAHELMMSVPPLLEILAG